MNKISWKKILHSSPKYLIRLFLLLFTFYEIVPVYYVLVSSFKTQMEALRGPLNIPHPFRTVNYVTALQTMSYLRDIKNNLIISVSTVFLIVVLASIASYPLARCKIKINKVIFVFFLAGMMIPGQMLIFPLFKMMAGFGLVDNLLSVIICMTAGGLPFAIFLFTGFIKTIPYDLEEAAYIDGCGPLRTFWKIVLPLLKPVIATIVILDALSTWNDFLTPLVFLQSRDNKVLLMDVFSCVGRFGTDFFAMLPLIVLSVAPMMIFYLFMQRYIIKGVIAGSIKG